MPLGAFKTALMGAAGGGDDENALEFLASVTVSGSTTHAVTFTSAGSAFPWSDFRHLRLNSSTRGDNMVYGFGYWEFNGTTGSSSSDPNETKWYRRMNRHNGDANGSFSMQQHSSWTDSVLSSPWSFAYSGTSMGTYPSGHTQVWTRGYIDFYNINDTNRWQTSTSEHCYHSRRSSGETDYWSLEEFMKEDTDALTKFSMTSSGATSGYWAADSTFHLYGIRPAAE